MVNVLRHGVIIPLRHIGDTVMVHSAHETFFGILPREYSSAGQSIGLSAEGRWFQSSYSHRRFAAFSQRGSWGGEPPHTLRDKDVAKESSVKTSPDPTSLDYKQCSLT